MEFSFINIRRDFIGVILLFPSPAKSFLRLLGRVLKVSHLLDDYFFAHISKILKNEFKNKLKPKFVVNY
jgi:hypothetical protein